MMRVMVCGSRSKEAFRLRTLRRTFATSKPPISSGLSVPSAVDRPTVRELLAASTALPSLPPRKCIASLAEVTSTAITEKKEEDLLESPDFVTLLQRVESRLFGFSANEAYLLVSCLARLNSSNASTARLPGGVAVSRIVQISLEQLSGDWQELSDMELAHAAQLLTNFARDSIEVDFTGFQQVLRARADRKQLSSRALCLASAAMAQAPQHCLEALAISLAAAARSDDRLSPTQLSSLALCLVRLGQSQAGLVVDALQRLAAVAEELSSEALCCVVETAAVLREREVLELLLRRCTEVAHSFPAGAAIRILKNDALASVSAVAVAVAFAVAVAAKSVESESTVSTKSSASTTVSLESLSRAQSVDGSLRRVRNKMQAEEDLHTLLAEHGFAGGVNCSRESGGRRLFFCRSEVIHPIHFAAKHGDAQLVRRLLTAMADPHQKTSAGRTALDIAKKSNKTNLPREIEALLGGDLEIVSVRQFRRMAKEAWMQ
ncbi:hypothetical protein AK812_SmicGene19897 [Symbiodinium microadriaticum]|uniref:Uncharacterized protein n=1 Tax=Symbiodinium microadriaticum TaxID=2951 RepID=A0A1Q9DRD8_SYMMI|nr:hypothetical protein AK812_SmicGene19897 [Symbiodinium microadriaticum]